MGAPLADSIQRHKRRARGQRGGEIAARRDVDIGGELHRASRVALTLAQPLDRQLQFGDVGGRMHRDQLIGGGGARIQPQHALGGQRLLGNQRLDQGDTALQPLWRLWKLLRHEVIEHRRIIDQRRRQPRRLCVPLLWLGRFGRRRG